VLGAYAVGGHGGVLSMQQVQIYSDRTYS
jgi:hypothetical protein